uniref:HpcH/HpaI aldolase/citrate lyase family protein n=1 Tax=Parerythrobacter lutipelagi TaxID=1964208 RepID=UPI0010F7FF5F|nr:aldolase/citrate lyase family protein [Parerythrobacter lutipelagi]
MRSWLFIEGDNPKKMAKAPMVGADAVVVDVSHIPVDSKAPALRAGIVEWLNAYNDPLIAKKAFARWVRIKPLDAPHWREELLAIMEGAPEGVILPKATGSDQIRTLGSELYEIEQKLCLKHNSTKIIPQVGETPAAALKLHELTDDRQPRLNGFAWNAEAVARGMAAKRTRYDDGRWTDALSHVRAMTLILARSIGVMAIDTPNASAKNADQARRFADFARQDGFTGMAATHPVQISAIHDAYSLSAKEKAEADAVIGSFNSRSVADILKDLGDPDDAEVSAPAEEAQGIRALT